MGKEFLYQTIHLSGAQKEIRSWPNSAKKNLGTVLTRLQLGVNVGFPDIRPMPTVLAGCYEVRIQELEGNFRVFYVIKTEVGLVVFHAFQKKTQKTPPREIHVARKRFAAFYIEVKNEKE